MTLLKKRSARGFTLVELMIVVAIIGILAALAIAGVKKYMTSAKASEARNSIGTIMHLASMAWSGEQMDGGILANAGTVGSTHTLCPSTAAVPAAVPAAVKYQSSTADLADFHTPAWKCLGFSLDAPQYYQYQYLSPTAASFSAVAIGDLDGDTKTSTFKREGVVQDGEIKMGPALIETDPDE